MPSWPGESGRCALIRIRQVMVCDDHVKAVRARPFERFVCADAAVNADDEFAAVGCGAFEHILPDAVAFSETVRNMKSCLCTQKIQRAEENRRAGSAINVVVPVNEYAL